MRIFRNTNGAQPTAVQIWDPLPVNEAIVTIPDFVGNAVEVAMTVGGHKHVVQNPCRDAILWTAHASGGCTPFIAVARNGGVASAFALAHLCFDWENEVRAMGRAFQGINAENVYLAMVKPEDTWASGDEQNFGYFEQAFGSSVAEDRKAVVYSTTPHAALTSNGYFGEISHAQVDLLKGGRRGGGTGGGVAKNSCCVIL